MLCEVGRDAMCIVDGRQEEVVLEGGRGVIKQKAFRVPAGKGETFNGNNYCVHHYIVSFLRFLESITLNPQEAGRDGGIKGEEDGRIFPRGATG